MTNYAFTGYSIGTDLGSTTGCTRIHGASGEIIVGASSLLNYTSLNESLYVWNAGGTNHKFGATIRSTGDASFFLGAIRVVDVQNFIGWRKDGGGFQVFKRVGNTFTQLGSTVAFSPVADYYLEGSIEGNVFTLRYNGTPVVGLENLTISDPVLQTSSSVGLHGRSQGGTGVIVSVNVEQIASQTITSVNSGNPVKIGGTVAVTVGGFTKPITKGTIDGVNLVSASNTSITVPSFSDGSLLPRKGLGRTLFLSSADDTETATINIEVTNPDGWASTVIESGFTTGETNSIDYNFSPPLAVDDIIFYDPTKGTVYPDAGYEGTYAGTQTMWHHDESTKTVYSFPLITGEGVSSSLNRSFIGLGFGIGLGF